MKHSRSFFKRFSKWTARAAGQPVTFAMAVLMLVAWGATGPIFHFSDTWQLVINTGTTIITFLMVFLIQSTQNRESAALNLKVDELIRSTKGAKNALLDLEEMEEDELDAIRDNYLKMADHAHKAMQRRTRAGSKDKPKT
jgi:low affinity Fe/Cu permease